MKIYVTYCSARKNEAFKGTDVEVTPDVSYTSKNRIIPFMDMCKALKVEWAIFSDLYGIWFPDEKHVWYEKSPDGVTEGEFRFLLDNFDTRLARFDEIFFYRPSQVYFHGLYKRLLWETELKNCIKIISSIYEIK